MHKTTLPIAAGLIAICSVAAAQSLAMDVDGARALLAQTLERDLADVPVEVTDLEQVKLARFDVPSESGPLRRYCVNLATGAVQGFWTVGALPDPLPTTLTAEQTAELARTEAARLLGSQSRDLVWGSRTAGTTDSSARFEARSTRTDAEGNQVPGAYCVVEVDRECGVVTTYLQRAARADALPAALSGAEAVAVAATAFGAAPEGVEVREGPELREFGGRTLWSVQLRGTDGRACWYDVDAASGEIVNEVPAASMLSPKARAANVASTQARATTGSAAPARSSSWLLVGLIGVALAIAGLVAVARRRR